MAAESANAASARGARWGASAVVISCDAGATQLAGVYNPFTEERFGAERGSGATLNGRPIRVSSIDTLSEALIITAANVGFHIVRSELSRFFRIDWT